MLSDYLKELLIELRKKNCEVRWHFLPLELCVRLTIENDDEKSNATGGCTRVCDS